jgi:tetratricopeptide (TPR) repeat protein
VVAEALNNLGLLSYFQQDYDAAHAWAERAVQLLETLDPPPAGPVFAATLTNLAQIEAARGELEQAESSFQRAETLLRIHYGHNSIRVARAQNNRAEVLGLLERTTEAELAYLSSLAILEQLLAPDDLELTVSLNNLGRMYRVQKRYEEAENVYRRSIEILEGLPAQAHPDLAASLFNLARVYVLQSMPDKADPLYQRALTLYEGTLGPDHPNVVAVRDSYAEFLRDNGRADEVERLAADGASN